MQIGWNSAPHSHSRTRLPLNNAGLSSTVAIALCGYLNSLKVNKIKKFSSSVRLATFQMLSEHTDTILDRRELEHFITVEGSTG